MSWKEVSNNTGTQARKKAHWFHPSCPPLPPLLFDNLGTCVVPPLASSQKSSASVLPQAPVTWWSRSHSIYTVLWGEVWKDLKVKERWEVSIKVCHLWRPGGQSNQPEFNQGSSQHPCCRPRFFLRAMGMEEACPKPWGVAMRCRVWLLVTTNVLSSAPLMCWDTCFLVSNLPLSLCCENSDIKWKVLGQA